MFSCSAVQLFSCSAVQLFSCSAVQLFIIYCPSSILFRFLSSFVFSSAAALTNLHRLADKKLDLLPKEFGFEFGGSANSRRLWLEVRRHKKVCTSCLC